MLKKKDASYVTAEHFLVLLLCLVKVTKSGCTEFVAWSSSYGPFSDVFCVFIWIAPHLSQLWSLDSLIIS